MGTTRAERSHDSTTQKNHPTRSFSRRRRRQRRVDGRRDAQSEPPEDAKTWRWAVIQWKVLMHLLEPKDGVYIDRHGNAKRGPSSASR